MTLNLAAGITSAIVVGIFAIAKFTEGAWVVVIVFPTLVFVLIRLNREYREEAAELRELGDAEADAEAVYSHHIVIVMVDAFDLATIEALRYGRSLRPSELRAVHFVLDDAHAAHLKREWEASDLEVPLELIECPDRRLGHATLQMIARAGAPRTEISILLPRRIYRAPLGRVLHDRTADHIARIVSDLPHAVAIIVPYDTSSRRGVLRFPAPAARLELKGPFMRCERTNGPFSSRGPVPLAARTAADGPEQREQAREVDAGLECGTPEGQGRRQAADAVRHDQHLHRHADVARIQHRVPTAAGTQVDVDALGDLDGLRIAVRPGLIRLLLAAGPRCRLGDVMIEINLP